MEYRSGRFAANDRSGGVSGARSIGPGAAGSASESGLSGKGDQTAGVDLTSLRAMRTDWPPILLGPIEGWCAQHRA